MDAFLDLSLDEDLRTHFICVDRNIDVESQRQIMGSPYTVIGTTDGGARPDKMDRFEYSTRLLGYWVREQQVMTLEDAGVPADGQDRPDARPGRPSALYRREGWPTLSFSTRKPSLPSPGSRCSTSRTPHRCT